MKKSALLTLPLYIAVSFWAVSANADFEEAMEIYARGDYTKAFEEYLNAAEDGDDRAFGKVAGLYLYGRGTEKDYIQSYIWFSIAANSGDKYAARFRDTAASMLSREQIIQAEQILAEKRAK